MDESVTAGGDDTTLMGARSPSASGDADISPSLVNGKCKCPVDDRRGASSAMAGSAPRYKASFRDGNSARVDCGDGSLASRRAEVEERTPCAPHCARCVRFEIPVGRDATAGRACRMDGGAQVYARSRCVRPDKRVR